MFDKWLRDKDEIKMKVQNDETIFGMYYIS